MAEIVNVGVKKNLVRDHVVVLKDCGERVVVLVEAVITPVDVDRGSRSGEGATRGAGAA